MESSIEFSQELAVSLYQSTEKFPIDLEEATIWLNYYDKATAKRGFLNAKFIEGVDYRISAEPTTTGISANPRQKILMTVDAFKMWSMMSGTEQGKKVRLYFLECEKLSKQVTEIVNPALLEVLTSMQKEMKLLSERTQKLDSMEKAANNNRGIKGVIDTEVMELYPETLSYTVREYLQMKGVDDRHLNTMRKRAVMFANQGKQINLPRKGNEYVFRGNDISYLDQALKTVLGLD